MAATTSLSAWNICYYTTPGRGWQDGEDLWKSAPLIRPFGTPSPKGEGKEEGMKKRQAVWPAAWGLFVCVLPAHTEGELGLEEVAVHMDGEGALLQLGEAGGDAEA